MLLAQLTINLQNNYASIQAQVEALQEQQRLIQAQLQRVGSVESKMESAAALLQEAIAEINDVCPGEVTSYQETINSLFGGTVAGILPEVADEPEIEPQPEPEPAPETPTNETITIDVPSTNGNGHHPLTLEQLQLLDWRTLRQCASDRNITDPNSRRLTRAFAEQALTGILTLEDENVKMLPEDILRAIQEVPEFS